MRRVRAAVIGGGVVGVGTLYHLARKGWSDSVLFERKELTSGSTWHAAGLMPLFNLSYSVGQIHKYSVAFYQELEKETGMDVGFRKVSNIRIAQTPDRMDEYRYYAGIARTLGIRVDELTPAQIKEQWPLVNEEGLVGGIQHPDDGYIQPADLTQAMAKGARDRGATIHRYTRVTAIEKVEDGWHLSYESEKGETGELVAEHVVTATGSFARQTGRMVGIDIPVIPVEHQYIVTEPHPAIQERKRNGDFEMGVLRDADSAWYMREEAGGLILGPYEPGAPACYVQGPEKDSEYEPFQEDLDRIAPHIESAMERVPIFGEVGVKKVYNGAIAYTPDGSPIVGPAPGLDNFWLNEGHSFGITAAGGAGWQLAEWIVEGEPTIDMMGVDPRRFGPYATEGYLIEKNEEAYRNVFTIHYPEEERHAARPLKTSPTYDRQKAMGAVFGVSYGWERANWYAPGEDYGVDEAEQEYPEVIARNHLSEPVGNRHKERLRFGRSNAFKHVGEEVRAVNEGVGVLDMTPFAKMEVSGPGAREWLETILANRIPKKAGRVALAHLLSNAGGVVSEFTLSEWAPGRFYLVSSGGLETHDHDTLRRLLPADGSVRLTPLTGRYGVLVLAGPRSREVLSALTRADLSNEAFPWLSGQHVNLGVASAWAMRVNFVGELGWELHHPIEMQRYIWERLFEAGEPHGIRPFGIRAMNSMAVEKSYRSMGRELSIEYNALDSGLQRFVRLDKEYRGSEAIKRAHNSGGDWRFVTMEVDADPSPTGYDVRGSEAIFVGDELVGRATNGGHGWRVGKSLALGMVRPDHAKEGASVRIRMLGEERDAVIVPESPFDGSNERLRA